jgi:hypothetical protein
MNRLLQYGIAAAAVYAAIRLVQMKNVADLMTLRLLNPRIHKADFGGIVFRTEAVVNNPTNDRLTITQPVVTLSSRGSVVTQSRGSSERLTIAPLSETVLQTFEMALPWSVLAPFIVGIMGRVPQIIAAAKAEGDKAGNIAKAIGIPLDMHFSTYAGGLYYESPKVKLL